MTANNTHVIQQVLSLKNKDLAELKVLWRDLFDTVPPPHSKTYLIPRLAYRLQELAYGPLSDKATQQLNLLTDQMEAGKKLANHFLANKPTNGTKLTRAYRGVQHEVTVTDNGFVYAGQTYKSLSVIARKITGVRWNGPAFFGLRNNSRKQVKHD